MTFKSKEQEEFESLIMGSKHFGCTATEDRTKDGENISLMTKSSVIHMENSTTEPKNLIEEKKNISNNCNQKDVCCETNGAKEPCCEMKKVDKDSEVRHSYPMTSKNKNRKPSAKI